MPKTYEETEEEYLKTERNSKAFIRLIREIFHDRTTTAKVVISVVITALAGTFYPLALGLSIDGILARNELYFVSFALLFLLLFFVVFLSNRLRTVQTTKLAQQKVKDLRDRAFLSLQEAPINFFSKVKTGYLISRITNDAENLSEFLTFQLPQVISGIVTVVFSVVIMSILNFPLTLYALLIVPVLLLFTFSLQGRVMRNYLATRKTIAAITGSMSETINAFRAIKSYSAEESTESAFSKLNQNNYSANLKAAKLSSLFGSVVRIIEAFGIVFVIYEGSMELSAGLISIGILVSFILYVQEFFDPVTQLSQLYTSYQSAMVGVSRIYSIIDVEGESTDGKRGEIPLFRDSIEFKDVSFSYGSALALKDVNVRISRGDKIGIVGHTGAGKTTFSNLLLGFYRPTKGEIFLDGKNLEKYDSAGYRHLIAPVLQDIFLFRGTVMENISFSNPSLTRDEIVSIARECGLIEIFEDLPGGFDTEVGELGSNLSDGQKQAVSLMRAFALKPEILLMDEPTSQIDPFTESVIIEALRRYVADKTLVLITHRFSMISLIDRIIVIDNGIVVQEGSFESLNVKGTEFYNLYQTYSGAE